MFVYCRLMLLGVLCFVAQNTVNSVCTLFCICHKLYHSHILYELHYMLQLSWGIYEICSVIIALVLVLLSLYSAQHRAVSCTAFSGGPSQKFGIFWGRGRTRLGVTCPRLYTLLQCTPLPHPSHQLALVFAKLFPQFYAPPHINPYAKSWLNWDKKTDTCRFVNSQSWCCDSCQFNGHMSS